MARNGSGVYSLPGGSTVTNGDTSDASDINTPLADIETDLNTDRPIVAGGTGASTAQGARSNLLFAKGSDIASASALTLGTDGNYFDVTGTTTITSINTWNVGDIAILQFDGALTLTHHATNLILPGGANITTAAGDQAAFVEYASGTWRCLWYTDAGTVPAWPYTFIDEDDMSSDSATAVPSQQSTKAYVDSYAGTYYNTSVFSSTAPTAFTDLDLSGTIGTGRYFVHLRITNGGSDTDFEFRTNGESAAVGYTAGSVHGGGTSAATISTSAIAYVSLVTDASSVVEWLAASAVSTTVHVIFAQQLQ